MEDNARRMATTATVDMAAMGARAKAASHLLARMRTAQKNAALNTLADELATREAAILAANAIDVANAKTRGVEPYFVDRLTLTPQRLAAIAADVRSVAALPDPIGEQFDHSRMPNGLKLHKRRIPLGVIGVIYESRPNVTVDITALCLKSGNAAILRGGSDNINSNRALMVAVQHALQAHDLPLDAVLLIDDPDRARILELLKLNDYVDLIIPRGGANLHKLCRDNSTIPVITGGMGINHIYVDESADQALASDVIFNAKVSKPSVCNALGTVLVQHEIAADFLPRMAARLAEKGVELRCDERAHAVLTAGINPLPADLRALPAGPGDWDTEWLSLTLGVKVVDSIDEALTFIESHSMEHSDAIMSNRADNIARFLNDVNSSAVFVNCSTRFNDGGQFGLGAEVAVSTQRIHARGPMGLRELTSYKWVCEGDGQVRW
jgi:glutamate-5-semialdehyde dehydrogenase